jgi:hypothetical protein
MTVVNAIRFDDYSGAMVCDEQVSWGDMSRKGDVGDKIQSIIPPGIQKTYGVAAAYGGSGTSAISEEIKNTSYELLEDEVSHRDISVGLKPDRFLTIQDIADRIFRKLSVMKRSHVDEYLFHQYGFRGIDLIRGYYMAGDSKVEIKQKEIIEDAHAAMSWKGRYPNLGFLYVNRGILSGYEPQEGYRIFYFNMMTFSYEPVQAVFQSIGSGQDTSDIAFADFVSTKTVQERRIQLDRVEAMVSIIHATNLACDNNVGVGEAVSAFKANIITKKLAYDLVGDLVFGNISFEKAERNLYKRCRCQRKLSRYLRGYKPEENVLAKNQKNK